MSKKFVALTTVLVFLVLGSCIYRTRISRLTIVSRPFDQNEWLKGVTFDYVKRPAMARWLVNNNSLTGKSRAEVSEMLGSGYQEKHSNSISYPLEDIYGWDIDPVGGEDLYVHFNNEGKVERAEIVLNIR